MLLSGGHMNRAERRHLQKRAKQRVKRRLRDIRWFVWYDDLPRVLGKGAKTRKVCSGYCCGARRRWDGMTLQERRGYQDYLEQLEDIWNSH